MNKTDLAYGIFLLALIIVFSIVYWNKHYNNGNK